MNDRYLFKAKTCNGEWVTGLLTKMWGQLHIINLDDENTAYPIDEDTICQCTGLEDENGNLIWENDIVKCQDVIGKVGWNETHLAFTVLVNSNGNMQYYYMDESLGEDIEVIGSMIDNPELLEMK